MVQVVSVGLNEGPQLVEGGDSNLKQAENLREQEIERGLGKVYVLRRKRRD